MLIFLVYKLVDLVGDFGCGCCERATLNLLDHAAIASTVVITTVVIEVMMLKIVPWI
jgi:hypothetical protein